MKEFELLPGWESIIDWKLQPWHGGKGPSLSLLARGPDGRSWRCRELSRGLRSPPRCPAAAGTSRLPPSFLCQAAVGGHTEGGPVRGLGTKQPRLSQSHPASLPFYVCPMLGWHPPTAGGIKIALWRKVQSPWAREALERILSVVTDQRRAWS